MSLTELQRRRLAPVGRAHVAVIVAIAAFIIAVVVIEPCWRAATPPFPMPLSKIRVAAPLDGPFYVQNGLAGFRWTRASPDSLWFHPLLSLGVKGISAVVNGEIAFWILTLLCGALAVPVLLMLAPELFPQRWNPWVGLLFLVTPGGLSLGVGNPEVPTLLFLSVLLLLVLRPTGSIVLICIVAGLAVLTKPTAMLVVPSLVVYFIGGTRRRDRGLAVRSAAGIVTLCCTFCLWVLFVGLKSHDPGAYWAARRTYQGYVPGDAMHFFVVARQAVRWQLGTREAIRFGTALLVPVITLWVALAVPVRDRVHRLAFMASVCTLLAYVIGTGNPNKAFLYLLVLPFQPLFYTAFLTVRAPVGSRGTPLLTIAKVGCLAYCGALAAIFVLGMPRAWFY